MGVSKLVILYYPWFSFSRDARAPPPSVGQDLLFIEASQSRSDSAHSGRLNSQTQRHLPDDRQNSMPQAGFEPTISASERPQTHDLERAATVLGNMYLLCTPCDPPYSLPFHFNALTIFGKHSKSLSSSLCSFNSPVTSTLCVNSVVNIQWCISHNTTKLYYVHYCTRATCFDSYRIIFRPF